MRVNSRAYLPLDDFPSFEGLPLPNCDFLVFNLNRVTGTMCVSYHWEPSFMSLADSAVRQIAGMLDRYEHVPGSARAFDLVMCSVGGDHRRYGSLNPRVYD